MIQSKLIIFTAVQIETRAIAQLLRNPHPNWPPVELHTIGIRAVLLPKVWANRQPIGQTANRGTGILPVLAHPNEPQPADPAPANLPAFKHGQDARATLAVIMAGLAGALDPSLRIGDVIIDDSVAPVSNPCSRTHAWVTNPRHAGAIRPGRIHTADHLIATPAEKADLFRQTGASVVDMENSIVRAAASAAGVPFIGIRAVSDTADQSLDPALLAFIDHLGRPRPAALAATLLRRPTLIPSLARLEKPPASPPPASPMRWANCSMR